MADVKDILGVSRAPQGDAAAAPAQKAKPERMKRPEGMSREAFALLGGSNPVIPSHLLDGLKKKDKLAKPKASTKGTVIYRYKQFKNQARWGVWPHRRRAYVQNSRSGATLKAAAAVAAHAEAALHSHGTCTVVAGSCRAVSITWAVLTRPVFSHTNVPSLHRTNWLFTFIAVVSVTCRDDGLELRHWVKGYKDANGRIRDAQEGDYAFAKYNKKVGPH
eukprot:GHRQ01038037.1.p1 GENE.GHRQ01038037.1~~GHRQ01038037.1.p1  ORF type:complete len:219 (+),score=73.56 GHRQ01038037.1:154-810(+)